MKIILYFFRRSDTSFKGQFKTDFDETDSVQYNRLTGLLLFCCEHFKKKNRFIWFLPFFLDDIFRISGCQQFMAIIYKKAIFMREQWIYWFMLVSVCSTKDTK